MANNGKKIIIIDIYILFRISNLKYLTSTHHHDNYIHYILVKSINRSFIGPPQFHLHLVQWLVVAGDVIPVDAFAKWSILVIPVQIGVVAARVPPRSIEGDGAVRAVVVIDVVVIVPIIGRKSLPIVPGQTITCIGKNMEMICDTSKNQVICCMVRFILIKVKLFYG